MDSMFSTFYVSLFFSHHRQVAVCSVYGWNFSCIMCQFLQSSSRFVKLSRINKTINLFQFSSH